MSVAENFPHLAIDPAAFVNSLNSGALDDCLDYLRGEEGAALNCRLAERLFHNGRSDEALECAWRAFTSAPDDGDTAHFCAWLFSNCGCHEEAAAAYERLIAHDPD